MQSTRRTGPASVVLRSPKRTLLVLAFTAQICVFTSQLVSDDDRDPSWLCVLWAGFLVVAVLGLADVLWRRTLADSAGVRVRIVGFRRRFLSWRQIHHFEDRGWRRGFGVWTVDRRWIGLAATATADQRVFAERAALERYRVEQQHALGLF